MAFQGQEEMEMRYGRNIAEELASPYRQAAAVSSSMLVSCDPNWSLIGINFWNDKGRIEISQDDALWSGWLPLPPPPQLWRLLPVFAAVRGNALCICTAIVTCFRAMFLAQSKGLNLRSDTSKNNNNRVQWGNSKVCIRIDRSVQPSVHKKATMCVQAERQNLQMLVPHPFSLIGYNLE